MQVAGAVTKAARGNHDAQRSPLSRTESSSGSPVTLGDSNEEVQGAAPLVQLVSELEAAMHRFPIGATRLVGGHDVSMPLGRPAQAGHGLPLVTPFPDS